MDLLIVALVALLAVCFRPLRKPLGWTFAAIVLVVLVMRVESGRARADEARQAEALDQCVKKYEATHLRTDDPTAAWFEAAAHC
jgi:hypothetical protein